MTRILRALLCLACLSAAVASAQNLSFTFTGQADGDIGGTPFTNATYTFTLTGDGAQRSAGGFPITVPLTAGTITITGTACAAGCTITTPGNYIVFNTGGGINVHGISLLGQPFVAGATFIEGCWGCGGTPVNDPLTATIPLTPAGAFGALSPYPGFATSGGIVTITALGSIAYAAGGFNVPTLSEWALLVMAALLGVAGFWHLGRKSPFAV